MTTQQTRKSLLSVQVSIDILEEMDRRKEAGEAKTDQIEAALRAYYWPKKGKATP